MRRLLITLCAGALALAMLTGCSDLLAIEQSKADAQKITAQAAQTEAEAQRLSAETTRAQAATQLEAQRALVATANARANDLWLVVALAFILAALSMGLSVALAFALRSVARQTTAPPIVYQVTAQPTPAQLGAQQYQGTPEFQLFVQQKARRRELLEANERRIL